MLRLGQNCANQLRNVKLTKGERQWVDSYRRELTQRYASELEGLLIYGSKARGEGNKDSDLDMLLIVQNSGAGRMREMRRIGYLLAADGEAVPSIIGFTSGEWERLKQSGSRFREAVERDEVPVL